MMTLRWPTVSIMVLSLLMADAEAKIKPAKPETDAGTFENCDTCGDDQVAPLLQVAASSGGEKLFPLPSCKGIRSDNYGNGTYGARRRSNGRGYSHTGVDWKAKIGTPLKSPAPGTVTQASCSGRAGCTIRITHTDGSRTVYMHIGTEMNVKKNSKVKAGQSLGTTSNTGNAKGTTPHLHFEYYSPNGSRQNPSKIFGC